MAERNLSIRLSVVDGGKVKAELSEIGEKGERSLKKIEAASKPASSGLRLLSSAANDAKFQLQAATDRLGMLGSVLGKLGPAGLLAGASIAALGVGITALVMPVARVGDEFFKLSQKTGVSVEALTALNYAAKLSDVSTEGLTKALQRLSVALFDSRFEGGEGGKALKSLGVAATDASGQIRPTEQVLLDLADQFANMPDGADKAALAMKLFGKEGLSIIPFLNQGREGIAGLMDEAQRLGLVMSEDVARASEVFNDNLARMSAIFEGVQRQIGAAVIPVLADFTEQVILAQGETGSFSNELQRITANREATLAFLESVASGLAFIAESAVLAKRVIAQPFDSLSVVGKDIETWFKTEVLKSAKNYGFNAQAVDAEIAKLKAARDDYVRAANDRLFNINQNPGYVDRVQKFFDEQRRTVRVMGQKFVLDTEAQAKEVQAIYDKLLPTLPRPARAPLSLDLSGFEKPKPAEKLNEGEAFLNQLRSRLTRTQDGEAAELRARALQIEAKGYQGVVAQAEQYIQVLEAIERQKEKDKAFDAFEKEEAASRKITEGLIGSNRQRIEALHLQREMLDLNDTERALLQARTDLEKAAAAARKEANQIEDAGLRVQTLEAINEALTRQLPIVEDLVRTNAEYQRSFEYGAKSALRSYIDDATNAAKRAQQVTVNAFRSMEDALTRFVMTGKLDFRSLADSIVADLVRIQIQRAITLPLANWLGSVIPGMGAGFGGSAAGSAFPAGSSDLMGTMANVAHSGGVIGADALITRSVNPALFTNARRFHTGGIVKGEVPIIAQEGEAVFTRGQMRALGGALSARQPPAVNVQVNVVNKANGVDARIEQQRQPDGGLRLDVFIEQIEGRMARAISQGTGIAPTLERRYGLNPAMGAVR